MNIYKLILMRGAFFNLCPIGHLTGTAAMLSELYCSIHEKICMVAGARFRSIEAVIVAKAGYRTSFDFRSKK
jgi:hypothetical protein